MGIPGKDVCPKGHQGFESLPLRNFARNAKSPEKGERIAECGGRGGIPP